MMDVELSILIGSIILFIFAVALAVNQRREASALSMSGDYKERPSRTRKERRLHIRHKVSLPIRYKTALQEREDISWMRDISRGGARFFVNKSFTPGTSLKIEVKLPFDAQPIFFQGSIVWYRNDEAGLSFERASHGDVDRIIQYIYNRQKIKMT